MRVVAVAFTFALLAAGAAGASSPVELVLAEMEASLPSGRLELEDSLRLGPLRLALARGVLRWADEDGEADEIVGSVRRLEVASYRWVGAGDGRSPALGARPAFAAELTDLGFELALAEREDDDASWVFYDADTSGTVRRLLVVTLDGRQLELVLLDGRLDDLLAAALDAEDLFD